MARVIWSMPALDDLAEIAGFIERDSTMAASSMVRQFFEATDQLEHFAQMGRMIPEIGDATHRELIVGPFRVMYVIDGDAVVISAVIHGARDWTPPA